MKIQEMLGKIPKNKKELASIIIILLQAYRDDSPLLETELKEIKKFVDNALKEIEQKGLIGYKKW